MNWETFQDAYNKATPQIKSLINSDVISVLIDGLIMQSMVHETMRSSLLITISNYLVGIFDDNSIEKELLGLGMTVEISHRVCLEIKKIKLGQTTTPISLSTLDREIAEVEHVNESLRAVRTIQQDVERIQQETPIHQSSQDTLLQRSSTPVQKNQQPPRWETE